MTAPRAPGERAGPSSGTAARPDRRVLAGACALSAGTLLFVIWWLTPWEPLGPQAPDVHPDVAASFSPEEVARAQSFREALGPWGVITTLATILAPWLAWWALGRRRRNGPGDPRERTAGHPKWLIVATVAGLSALVWMVGLPQSLHAETVLRRFGLSTQDWPGWLQDEAIGWGMSFAVTALAVLGLWWVIRRLPRMWPYAVAVVAAGVTVLGSFVWPAVVEPAYNDFRPLAAGELRDDIEELARAGGFGPMEILVSDASRRTIAHNAYVSGLGATRRVVVYDTVAAAAAESARAREAAVAIVAHELAHVSHRDVARGTTIGAVGAFTAVLVLALVSTTPAARRSFRPGSSGSRRIVRSVVLLLAVTTTLQWVAAPVSALVSRRIEAAADVGALELTRDPAAFQRMQHELAVTNLSRLENDPDWWRTLFFSSHPSAPWRIAQAQVWADLHTGAVDASRTGLPDFDG